MPHRAVVHRDADFQVSFRRVSLALEEAQLLEAWLILVCGRSAAPHDCGTFLALLREAMRSQDV